MHLLQDMQDLDWHQQLPFGILLILFVILLGLDPLAAAKSTASIYKLGMYIAMSSIPAAISLAPSNSLIRLLCKI